MKVSISSQVASLEVELPEEKAFDLFDIALGYAGKRVPRVPVIPPLQTGGVIKKPEVIVPFGDKTEEVVKTLEEVVSKTPATVHLNGEPLSTDKPTFKGFLYLKCEKCGKHKGFMPKSPISTYRCDCGHHTEIENVKAVYAVCKCGVKFKYLTNSKDKTLTIDCINCKAPIDLEYHEKNQVYSTISD